ncbi:trypsin [Oesophagostomum dentatum]|uniref:Trypsin n=1 Tax=Oesophagostomum dentatum TaxID=61180 RepID=A0A0B1T9T8_OESDE|nr:trypsin [Oesophagostomum dentatum]
MRTSVYKVINGNRVKPNEFPFIASTWDTYTGSACTAVMISKHHVLTAAHCVVEEESSEQFNKTCRQNANDHKKVKRRYSKAVDTVAYAGSRCPYPDNCSPSIKEYTVKRIVVDPEYNICNLAHDLAIVELSRDVDEKESIPICMPGYNLRLPKKLMVAGYGVNPFGKRGGELHVASLSYHEQKDGKIVTSDKNKNACSGDSGGPLFYSSDGIFTLLGITSSTSDACTKSSTGGQSYFIDVRANLDWICDETVLLLLSGIMRALIAYLNNKDNKDKENALRSLPGVTLERIQSSFLEKSKRKKPMFLNFQ